MGRLWRGRRNFCRPPPEEKPPSGGFWLMPGDRDPGWRRDGGPPGGHMLSIITWPKPEQLTWVAPSIRRAKS